MATRSTIAMQFDDGSVKQVYCHWDGYLEGVGKTLFQHYTPEKVEALLAEGDLSSLGAEIGSTHAFDHDTGLTECTFYRRDRGDSGCLPREFGSLDDYEMHRQYEEFDYLLTNDGIWSVFIDDDWNDLEYLLMKNSII